MFVFRFTWPEARVGQKNKGSPGNGAGIGAPVVSYLPIAVLHQVPSIWLTYTQLCDKFLRLLWGLRLLNQKKNTSEISKKTNRAFTLKTLFTASVHNNNFYVCYTNRWFIRCCEMWLTSIGCAYQAFQGCPTYPFLLWGLVSLSPSLAAYIKLISVAAMLIQQIVQRYTKLSRAFNFYIYRSKKLALKFSFYKWR